MITFTLPPEVRLVNAIERARQLAEDYAANRKALRRLRPAADAEGRLLLDQSWDGPMPGVRGGPNRGGDEDAGGTDLDGVLAGPADAGDRGRGAPGTRQGVLRLTR